MILIKQESNYKFITKYLLVYDMIQKKITNKMIVTHKIKNITDPEVTLIFILFMVH